MSFLRHIERCLAVAHVIDCATYEPGRDPLTDLDIIEGELAAYGGLEDRPRLIVLNKIDIPDARDLAELVTPELAERGWPVFAVSTKTGEGLPALTYAMADLVRQRRAEMPAPAPRVVLRPEPVASSAPAFTVKQMGDGEGGFVWRVRGEKPERWVKQTDFANPEAVGYLADRFTRLGIEERLLELGAREGDAVAIGAGDDPVVFDFAPQISSGAEILARDTGTTSACTISGPPFVNAANWTPNTTRRRRPQKACRAIPSRAGVWTEMTWRERGYSAIHRAGAADRHQGG